MYTGFETPRLPPPPPPTPPPTLPRLSRHFGRRRRGVPAAGGAASVSWLTSSSSGVLGFRLIEKAGSCGDISTVGNRSGVEKLDVRSTCKRAGLTGRKSTVDERDASTVVLRLATSRGGARELGVGAVRETVGRLPLW